jgi:hypothetical protein
MSISDEERTTALGLYNSARSYWKSAEHLNSAELKVTHPHAPIVFLLCHAIELYLKAFLRHNNYSLDELRKKWGHDVAGLSTATQHAGFKLSGFALETISHITDDDVAIEARYIVTGFKTSPTISALAEVAEELDRTIGEALAITGVPARNRSNQSTTKSPTTFTKELKQWAEESHVPRADIIQQLIPVALVRGPYIVIHVLPVSAYEEEKEISFLTVPNVQYSFTPFGYDKQLSRSDADSWSFYDPPSMKREGIFPGRFEPDVGQSMWFASLSRYGVVEFVSMVDTLGMPSDQGRVLIQPNLLESLIVCTVERFANGLAGLGIEAPFVVRAGLYDVQGCFLFGGRGPAEFTRQPIALPAVYLNSVESPLANPLRPLLDAVWRAAGLGAGSPSYNSGTWAGYERPNT